ncbi:S8 family peptidase [Marinifilum sp.]|uniref:S8 family peptidase n=1 Tax=Marinifilum sp. TaxID=2033137 RepID=UPI003BAA7DB5
MKSLLISCLLLVATYIGQAQKSEGVELSELDSSFLNWYNMDPELDQVQGASVNLAYKELLQSKEAKKKIVVAVLDGGVDLNHEDLKDRIWINENEIPNNGIDDDKNGYVDDVNGWNFLGNSKGDNIITENLEALRIVRKYEPIFKNVSSIDELESKDHESYQLYLICKDECNQAKAKYLKRKGQIERFAKRLNRAETIVKRALNKNDITRDDVKKLEAKNEMQKAAKDFLLNIYSKGFKKESFNNDRERTDLFIDKHLNPEFQPRKIIGDDVSDITDAHYGNNNVATETAEHGTFVAGIIAARRDNQLGIDGIAQNVEIMALRVVPHGDERDKDVALAIRYAVDNGADIVNMSFGKNYSPQKEMIDDAIKYAEENNVLLVHAAGNEGMNVDEEIRYPSPILINGKHVENFLSVGANSKNANQKFCGIFTNYGEKNVDIFAPGVDVISLHPENKYKMRQGTSYSAPVVAGVAALVWSYYPDLSAVELKHVLMSSSNQYKRLKVLIPNIKEKQKKKAKFTKLSVSGGTVNAYKALLEAEKLQAKKHVQLSKS